MTTTEQGAPWTDKCGGCGKAFEVPAGSKCADDAWYAARKAMHQTWRTPESCGYCNHPAEPPGTCPKCGKPLRCGPFMHAHCEGCTPKGRCLKCKDYRYMCCC